MIPLRSLAVDFNSYFASVEQQEQPGLRGRPVAVVPVLAPTTCCISVSQAAKRRGVRSEMGLKEAQLLCPELALVEARPDLYVQYHRQLLEAIESCIHVSEVKSIDEVECELTATFADRAKAVAVAKAIKREVARRVGACLTSSIGIAPNWTLAKMASDMQKPDGLVVLEEGDIPGRLLGLKLQDFLGIGPRMEARLHARGIDTVAKLYAATKSQLRGIWGGVEGERMHARIRGEAVPLEVARNKTIGHSHVLPPELRTDEKAVAVLHRLLQKAALRLRTIDHYAGALSVYVSFRSGESWEEEIRFNGTQDTRRLTQALLQALAGRTWRRRQPMQVGLVLHHLESAASHTPDLFEGDQDASRARVNRAMDELNQTFGHGSVFYGGAFGVTRNAPMRIAFTRIPAPEVEQIDERRERRLRPRPPAPAPDGEHPPQDSGT